MKKTKLLILTCAVLGAGFICALWPLLDQPFTLDPIDILRRGAFAKEVSLPYLFSLQRQPHAFRPFLGPLYWVLYSLFGSDPAPFRLAVMAAQFLTVLCLGGVAWRLSRSLGAALAATFLYAFCFVQWKMAVDINLSQSFGNLFFWSAFLLWLKSETGARRGVLFAAVLGLATAGLFLKEDAVVFPAWVLAAAWFLKDHEGKKRETVWAVAWGVLYLGFRVAFQKSSFTSPYSFYPFRWSQVLDGGPYRVAFAMMSEPVNSLFPSAHSLGRFLAWFSAEGPEPWLWILSGMCVGAALGVAWGLFLWEEREKTVGAGRIVLFSVVAGALSLIPYAFFERAVYTRESHRYALAMGAFSLGAGVCARKVGTFLIRRWKVAGAVLAGAFALPLFVRAALNFRFPAPGPRSPYGIFTRVYETRQIFSSIRRIARTMPAPVLLVGVRPGVLRICGLLQIAEGKDFSCLETLVEPAAGELARLDPGCVVRIEGWNAYRKLTMEFRREGRAATKKIIWPAEPRL